MVPRMADAISTTPGTTSTTRYCPRRPVIWPGSRNGRLPADRSLPKSSRRVDDDGERPMAEVPTGYLDLLTQKKPVANLATLQPDGSPQVTPVWFDYTDGKIRVNTAKGRVKARNLSDGAKVALSIVDPDNDYRYVQIRGTVTKATTDGAMQHIDSLAKKY